MTLVSADQHLNLSTSDPALSSSPQPLGNQQAEVDNRNDDEVTSDHHEDGPVRAVIDGGGTVERTRQHSWKPRR